MYEETEKSNHIKSLHEPKWQYDLGFFQVERKREPVGNNVMNEKTEISSITNKISQFLREKSKTDREATVLVSLCRYALFDLRLRELELTWTLSEKTRYPIS